MYADLYFYNVSKKFFITIVDTILGSLYNVKHLLIYSRPCCRILFQLVPSVRALLENLKGKWMISLKIRKAAKKNNPPSPSILVASFFLGNSYFSRSSKKLFFLELQKNSFFLVAGPLKKNFIFFAASLILNYILVNYS